MGEGGDIVVGEQLGQAIPAVHRQDGRERIQLQRAPGLRVRGNQAMAVGRVHRAPPRLAAIRLSPLSKSRPLFARWNGSQPHATEGRGGDSSMGFGLVYAAAARD